jgi:hypothetical protein
MTEEDYLTRCVVDPMSRTFYLYSSEGNTQVVECDSIEQFMDVLEITKMLLDDTDCLAYSNPLM